MRLTPMLLAGFLVAAHLGADTYPRQPGMDVQHYVFRLDINDESDVIQGQTTVTVKLRQDGVQNVSLDLANPRGGQGMEVSAATVDGQRVTAIHRADRLEIPLGTGRKAGEVLVLEIRYGGHPASGLKFLTNKHGERTVFSESWPDQAHQWLPVVDHPSDKATGEMIVTTPAQYQVISNGLLMETTDLPGSRRRAHWKQDQPLPVWLYTLGIARFAVHHPVPVGTVPLESWVFPQEREPGWRALEETSRQVLGFYSGRIAPYPYDKLANVEAAGIHGGMESATAIFYGEEDFKGGRMTMLLAHEIAHQWFGDSVTESDWNDIWLSESFATYLADCFLEHAEGREAFVTSMKAERAAVIEAEKRMPDTPIVHRNLSDMGKVLNPFVYEKGAWVLHMLRGAVGEEAFWKGLRAYYQEHCHGNVTTADFRRAMEVASGQNLGAFFRQWLTRPGLPKLAGRWRHDADRNEVIVDLQQTQTEDVFQLPLTLALGDHLEQVLLSQKNQQFTFPMPVAPAFVAVDPKTVALIEAPERLERMP